MTDWYEIRPADEDMHKPITGHEHKCGECVRFFRKNGGGYRCSSILGPKELTADREACRLYWDRAEQEREEAEFRKNAERERQERWEKNMGNPAVPAGWAADWDDSRGCETNEYPICPVCEEPLYAEGRCFFCGQAILTDEKLKEWMKPPEVKHMDCFKCGGKNTINYTESKINGHKHGYCTACGLKFME